MIGLGDLQGGTWGRYIRSRHPPSSRARLFMIGEHLIDQSIEAENVLTSTGGRHDNLFQLFGVGKKSLPAREAGWQVPGLNL